MPLLGEALHQAPSAPGHETRMSNPQGPLPASYHPQSPSDLLQVSSQVGFVTHRSKNKATDSQTSSLEMRAPVRIIPKLGNYLSNNTHRGNGNGQMANNRQGGQRYRRSKRREL
jgi:hypothetical protein